MPCHPFGAFYFFFIIDYHKREEGEESPMGCTSTSMTLYEPFSCNHELCKWSQRDIAKWMNFPKCIKWIPSEEETRKKLDETKTGKFVGLLPTRPGHITYIILCGMTSFELILNLVTLSYLSFFIFVIKWSFNSFQESLIHYFRKIHIILIESGNAANI